MSDTLFPKPNDTTGIRAFNRKAWDLNVKAMNRWTVIASPDEIEEARQGRPRIILTPKKLIPPDWLGSIKGKKILGLASGGGQQGPLLAAAGAVVTIVDLSPAQLSRDKEAAEKYGLAVTTFERDAADLFDIEDRTFDLIINPVSNCFFPNLVPVWQECARVLKPGGYLLTAFNNPVLYCFDFEKANTGEFVAKHQIPYSDLTSLSPKDRERFIREDVPLEWSHTLTDQIGGLVAAGFSVTGLYEDEWDSNEPINRFFPQFIAIRGRRNS